MDEELLYGKSLLAEETKKNLGICQDCGKTFNQGYRVDDKTGKKIFNKYKYCPKCRKIATKNAENKTQQVSIKYQPYPWQQKFHNSKARCKVVSGAARTGKDRSCTMEFTDKFIQMLNEERDYTYVPKVHGWIIAPTFRLAGQLIREMMNTFPRELVVSYDKESLSIETVNGGLIEYRSADDPDSLVSVGLDIVWITEAARIKKFDVVIGNITDRLDSPGRGPNGSGGLLLVNSSPRGRTYFNEVCRWGVEGGQKQRPNWETFYVSRWDNPYFANLRYKVYDRRIDKWVDRDENDPVIANGRTYEEDLMLSRSDRQYREDILGLPSDDAGSQFPNFREQSVIDKPQLNKEDMKKYIEDIQTPKSYYTYSIGYDPAKSIDGACLVVYCEQTHEAVYWKKLEKVPYTVQINVYIKDLVKKWNYAIVRYGKTGLGEALEDLFKMAGIAYIAYPEQGRNKEKLVENLTALVKSGMFKIHNVNDTAEMAIRQFEDYGFDISEKGKTITYSNMTAGQHDDFVSAAYFAVADITATDTADIVNFYSENNMFILNNSNSSALKLQNSFF